MDERAIWQATLEQAQRTLGILEEQAAGYTVLDIPPHLVIELDEKRKQVARLQDLIAGKTEPCASNLPRRDPFFGREKEITRALEALDPQDRGWGLLIDGIGGIGKTALAVELAYLCHEQARFDTFLFSSAKQTRLETSGERDILDATTPTLDAMLGDIARALGYPGVAQSAGVEKRSGLLDALRDQSQRVLLILDNLETLSSEEQRSTSEFLRRLPSNCKAIATSRRHATEGAVWLRLEKLGWPAARQLIQSEAGRAANLHRALEQAGEDRWQELHDAVGGSPLALRWTLGLMRARNLSLDRALDLLRSGAGDDSPLHAFIYREARREMAADDWRVLGALSLFAAPATFEALSATTDLSRLAQESALDRLHAFSLVDVLDTDGPYALHPLTRRLAAEELARQPELARELGQRFCRYWLDYAQRYGGGDKDAYRTYPRLEAEWPNLQAAAESLYRRSGLPGELEEEQESRRLVDLAEALSQFLWFCGRWDERVHLSEQSYQAARALEDWWKAGWRAFDVACIHLQRAETDRAEEWAERMDAAWARGGSRRDRAVATRMRGLLTEQRGELEEAERLYGQALAAYRELGEKAVEAIVLCALGIVAWKRQEYDRAGDYFRQALAIAEKLNHKAHQANYCSNLGHLALDQERPAEARPWLERALALAREVGRQDLIAEALHHLARVLEAEGHHTEALEQAEAALHIRRRLRHRDLEEGRELVERLSVGTLEGLNV